jgi:hypothetical protein
MHSNIIVQQEISPLNNGISFWNNKNSTMAFKEVPVAKSWPPSIRQKECIKCVCCDMYGTETYIIMLWRQLHYTSVICVIWYNIFTVFQNYWGVRHWLAKTVNSAFKFEVNVCGIYKLSTWILIHFLSIFIIWILIHMPLKKFLHIFTWPTLMIAINFRWATPSTVLKNSDPPPIFPSPPPFYFMTGP